jgi:ATPase subunit of ABC transporter with duplicated ATPase domains
MSIRLTASGLSLKTPDHRSLVEALDLVVAREVTGLVGANGAGKSTLLRALAGKVAASQGSVTCNGRLGWLAQISADAPGSVADALGITDSLARLDRITKGRAQEDDLDLANWSLAADAEAALAKVGLDELPLAHPLNSLSGGQRARVMLASAWLGAPDILLMDEPTNNLDREGREAVHALMRDWPGGLVVARPDRALLERVDRILALEGAGWRLFGGPWSAYQADRNARRHRADLAFTRAEARLRAVNRSRQAAEARLARRARSGKAMRRDGSQPKMLLNAMKAQSEATGARLSGEAARRAEDAQASRDTAEAARTHGPKLNVKAPSTETPQGRVMLDFETVSFAYDATPVIDGLSFVLQGGERIALEGPNGSGKTTVLRLAEGLVSPTAGEIRRGGGRLARLDQMVSDLDPALSAVEALRARYPDLSVNDAHAALAQFDLRGKASEKPLSVLSGGERLRVGLAGVLSGEPPAILIMDEPTNHLDLDAIEALEAALQAYQGTLIAVSHDEAFLKAIGIDRRIRLEPPRSQNADRG